MALANYTDLQNSVMTWLARPDIAAAVPDMIAIAEGRMSADIQARAMENRTTLTAIPGNAYLALPTDFLEARRLKVTGDWTTVLKYSSPDQIDLDYPTVATGRPQSFSVIGSNLQFGPVPDSAYSLELTYRQRIPALNGTTQTTNWLLTQFPQAYLFAALSEAAPFIGDDARIAIWEGKYAAAVETINSIDWYSGSTMTVSAS